MTATIKFLPSITCDPGNEPDIVVKILLNVIWEPESSHLIAIFFLLEQQNRVG